MTSRLPVRAMIRGRAILGRGQEDTPSTDYNHDTARMLIDLAKAYNEQEVALGATEEELERRIRECVDLRLALEKQP